jgi:molybdopterin molybdotransferase
MKPGRPFVFGKLGGKLLCGLPGNPVSAFVTFLLLVWPVIRRWQGAMEAQLSKSWGRLLEPVDNPDQRRHFLRVHLNAGGEVSLAGLQASHALASLAASNGLLDVPAGTVLAANSLVPVLRWDD